MRPAGFNDAEERTRGEGEFISLCIEWNASILVWLWQKMCNSGVWSRFAPFDLYVFFASSLKYAGLVERGEFLKFGYSLKLNEFNRLGSDCSIFRHWDRNLWNRNCRYRWASVTWFFLRIELKIFEKLPIRKLLFTFIQFTRIKDPS